METWYLMADGSAGDPREVAPDAKGVLCHKDGRKVAYREHGPRSISVDPDEERSKAKPKAKEMKPDEPKRTYATRDVKAR